LAYIKIMPRRPFAAAVLVAASFAACSDGSGPAPLIANGTLLAAELDTLHAALASPQLKSLGSLALPLLNLRVTVYTMDSTMLGRTVEWDPIRRQLQFTQRSGAPSNAIKLILYKNDHTGLPAYPPEEVGYAYLVPMNERTGGRPDSVSLRIAVFDNATPFSVVVGDIMAWRLPSDVACGQCASFSARRGLSVSGIARSTSPYRITSPSTVMDSFPPRRGAVASISATSRHFQGRARRRRPPVWVFVSGTTRSRQSRGHCILTRAG
jgi:hypothetical protein